MESQWALKRKIDAVLGRIDTAKAEPSRSTRKPRPARQAGTFAPWSGEQLVKRLETFRGWPYTEPALCGLAWARRGWRVKSAGSDAILLQCVTCRALSRAANGQTGAPQKELAEQIINDHKDTCSWRQHACKDDVLRVRFFTPSGESMFSGRLASLAELTLARLPTVPAGFDYAEQDTDAMEKARKRLACFGWQLTSSPAGPMLECRSCTRRCVLSMLQDTVFDCAMQHNTFCPWINAHSQGAARPAWQLQAEIVYGTSRTDGVHAPRLQKLRQIYGLT